MLKNANEHLASPFIPKSDNGYKENIKIDLLDQGVRNIVIDVPAKPLLEHEIEMWDTINKFETESWDVKKTGLKSGYKSVDKALDGGIRSGFYIIAADSNVGKSIFIQQLAWQIIEFNDEVYVMDFSLDDPMQDRISRVIASSNKVLINAVKSPLGYIEYPLMLARRIEGLNKLRKNTNKYKIYDSTFSTNIEDIEKEIQKIKINLEAKGKGNVQIVVCIDNFHDLTTSTHPNFQDKQKYDYLAQRCADIAIQYDIPLICTAELRKVNGNLRPTLDGIRESVKIKYEAKAILLCHNDVHYRGEGADVYFNRSDSKLKQSIFEVHFAKNKFSNFKGRIFFESYAEMARMEEADEESAKHYSSVIYGG